MSTMSRRRRTRPGMGSPIRSVRITLAGALALAALSAGTASAGVLTERQAPTAGAAYPGAGTGFRMPLVFEPNRGQVPAAYDFVARTASLGALFARDRIDLVVVEPAARPLLSARIDPDLGGPAPGAAAQVDGPRATRTLSMSLPGADPQAAPAAAARLPSRTHYYVGPDSRTWLKDVPNAAGVVYRGVYDGIDLRFEDSGDGLAFAFTVTPGGDPGDIALAFSGADGTTVDDRGDLRLTVGERAVTVTAPRLFQPSPEGPIAVDGRFVVRDDGQVVLRVDAFDRRRPLTIDPLVLVWDATTPGGAASAYTAVAVAEDGGVIVGGRALVDLPGADHTDTTIVRFSGDGALEWQTVFGGQQGVADSLATASESVSALALAADGSIYVAGPTESSDLPVLGAVQGTFAGGSSDGFVAHLSATADLLAATYLGGADDDWIADLAVDDAGSAVIVGHTESANFPLLGGFGPHQGRDDVFVAKFAPGLAALTYSILAGGSEVDAAVAVAVDEAGDLVVAGRTNSPAFASPAGAFDGAQPDFAGGSATDGFVFVLAGDGAAITRATYLGGADGDLLDDVAVAPDGSIHVVGSTRSEDYPLTVDLQRSFFDATSSVVLTRLDAALETIVFSARFGQHFSAANAVALDGRGSVFVAGTTTTAFPVDWPVPDAVPPSLDRAFLAVLADDGESIDDLAYVGGPASSGVYDMAVDAGRGRIFVAGDTVPSGVASGDVFVPDARYALLQAYAIGAEAAYGHSAKFVCGSPANPAPVDHWRVNNGTYGTSINVHNPGLESAELGYDVALTWPVQPVAGADPSVPAPGPVLPGAQVTLESGAAVLLDCTRIARYVFGGNVPPFFEGFLALGSDSPLEVTGVYTTGSEDVAANDDLVPGLDIEAVALRDRRTAHDLSVYTEVPRQRRRDCPDHVYGVDTRITNNGPVDRENLVIQDWIVSDDIDAGPDVFDPTYAVSHGGSFEILSEDDGEMAVVSVTIPRLPAGDTATIIRAFGVIGDNDTLSVIVTVSPSPQEQVLDNNSFERTYWVPNC